MRNHRAIALTSALALAVSGSVFWACGGGDVTNGDGGGGDGSDNLDSGGGGDQQNPQPDSGDQDVQPADTGTPDTGPLCTNNPCVVGLAVGGHHACALIADGTVRCWGDNTRGQLGAGGDAGAMFNGASHSIPIAVENVSGATEVAASTVYNTFGATCVRLGSGQILCFGSNGSGQLGLAAEAGIVDNVAHPFAAPVQGLPNGVGPSLGNFSGCAVAGTDLWCWGDNGASSGGNGQLGRGPTPTAAQPAGKATLLADAGISVTQGSAGSTFTVVVAANGNVYSWGGNGTAQLGRTAPNNGDPNPAPVSNVTSAVQVSAGAGHACAVTQAGQVLCWGDNQWGQLGRGIQGGTSANPTAVAMPNNKTVKQVSCSNSDTCALATDGTVYCWGRNLSGQVGWNAADAAAFNQTAATNPVQILGLTGKALYVGAGGTTLGNNTATGYACALIEGGSVECWGINSDDQLGRGPDAGSVANCPNNGGPCSPVAMPVVWQ